MAFALVIGVSALFLGVAAAAIAFNTASTDIPGRARQRRLHRGRPHRGDPHPVQAAPAALAAGSGVCLSSSTPGLPD